MNISAHEANNEYFYGNGAGSGTPWVLGWTAQQLVTAAIVTQTGETED